jgi:hypothetical protein
MTNSRRLIVLLLTFAVLLVGSERALAVTFSTGRTSQHGVARVFFAKPGVVISLIIELRTRCTDHKRRAIWPGFAAPFQHPRSADGRLGDSYDILGRDVAGGVRFRQRASLRARLTENAVTGSARVTQTLLATGVVCKSPWVTFSIPI